VQGLKPD